MIIERFEAAAIATRSFSLADQLTRLSAAVERLATAAVYAWREQQRHQDLYGAFAASMSGFIIVGSVPSELPATAQRSAMLSARE